MQIKILRITVYFQILKLKLIFPYCEKARVNNKLRKRIDKKI